jgi:hypothetical protein
MKFEDIIKMRGEVTICSVDDTGKVTVLVEDKNLIVLNGRSAIVNGLAGTSYVSITDVAFGNGGVYVGSSSVDPILPSDLTVKSAINGLLANTDYTFTINPVNTVAPKLIHSIVVPKTGTALNGQSISEIALMLNTTPKTAFSIKRFSSIPKTDAISLIITWIIYI